MRKERKHYTAEEKVAVLRRHLLDKVPVSDLCEELGLQPTMFYRWQKEFFGNGAAAFQATERPRRQAEEKQKRIEFLEKKVQTKDEVLAELMAEHIALKKVLGNSEGELGAARCAGRGGWPILSPGFGEGWATESPRTLSLRNVPNRSCPASAGNGESVRPLR